MSSFSSACVDLVEQLQKIDSEILLDKRTSAEDQLKVPLHNFLSSVGSDRPTQVNVFTEHRQDKDDEVQGVRLDMVVKNGRGQLIGHVELKATSKSANPHRQRGWSPHDKKQWKRLINHSNLIYTNGWEWTLLRHGSDKPIAHVVLDPRSDGSIPEAQEDELCMLLEHFLSWKPRTPSSPRGLADTLAPLTRFLRDSVIDVLRDSTPDALDKLYASWSSDLMPGATKEQFADSFAQTFTYALLLARVESTVPPEAFNAKSITDDLRTSGHRLIGAVLELMAQPQNRELVESPVSLLEATIGSVNVNRFTKNGDPWLYFYEDFLAAYDPKMRAEAGVYYTPVNIVETQVRLLDEILRTRYGRQDGLGDESTNILDNAAGTATYPLAVARHVLANAPSPQDASRSLAKRLFAFELLVGPYAVAHMRMTQMLESTGADLGNDSVQVYLTNSLTDPGEISDDHQQISLWEVMDDINEENRKAGLVKNSRTPIRVILGNPPYDRGSKEKALGAGSTRFKNIVLEENRGSKPLIEDFIEPLRDLGQGGQAKNLYNSYVYFIRWAIWKACEQHKNQTGVVTYITSSSYLRGPGFAGLREYMRRVFDEVWIVDLGGEGRGARKEENVFAIQTPVAIFFGIQHPTTASGSPKRDSDRRKSKATVFYRRISGTKAEKLETVKNINAPSLKHHPGWEELKAKEWGDKFVPSSSAALSDGIPLSDIYPWHVSGAQFKRKWPIAPSSEALKTRWEALFLGGSADEELFSGDRDCTIHSKKKDLLTGEDLPSLSSREARKTMATPARYGFRSFDRQWCFADHRVGTYLRQPLWDSLSSHQLYFVSLTTTPLGTGPAISISPYVPDMHFFRGSFGAKDVYPLYRTDSTKNPNISSSLISNLSSIYKREIDAFEVASYVAGLLGTSAYTRLFEEELAESVPHIPFTADSELFNTVATFGRKLIFEQTWGERGAQLNEFGQPSEKRFRGVSIISVPTPSGVYPESWSYNPETQQLHIGEGRFDHVPPEVMTFEVSGMNVVSSWLGYRMKTPAGKSSSPLDQIQSRSWHHDAELLELLWQLEYMVSAEKTGADLLHEVLMSEIVSPVTLGKPTQSERKAPAKKEFDAMF